MTLEKAIELLEREYERCAMKEVSEDDYCSFGERRRSYIV